MNRRHIIRLKHFAEHMLKDSETDIYNPFKMELDSDGILTLRGCRDVDEYTENKIFLVTDEYYICIEGTELYLKNFSKNLTSAGGNIKNIALFKNQGEKKIDI